MTHPDDSRAGGLIGWATAYLAERGIEQARREARLLFELAYGREVSWQLTHADESMPEPDVFVDFVRRRGAGEPMAYLSGKKGFWTLDLEVTPDTLIPRGDTETLIEALLRHRPDRRSVTSVLDLGTGSGCLLLAALSEYPQALGIGVDRKERTARQARKNSALNNLASRADFVVADWSDPLNSRFDVVLSNPPYIPKADIPGLMKDVVAYEPGAALDGGEDGLDAYRQIIPRLSDLLEPHGLAILEFGIGQEEDVAGIARKAGLSVVEHCSDLAGIIRAIVLSPQVHS
ncbi:peptide chain release factor N(5)-glutamine methyltransferase [Acetobacter sp.]|jgi:release factor glutamine methyltransferase|uniref:peptide chain release factor N(5)-glutamine methyltransferase n=1 Tax=Acetobacter sp. TaxID=440 RepID=UPI0025C0CC72|nr:peptide chain release factor N(5)-glutamine methyltransferase [Acetobacter sp.]MCH4090157.1 peptide chain release factor N(5)-glutamine methyltransferase [Acetobacter sp.]MCI1298851.1 peptide chain release factor N(5)-glutamine methyltransferase [Acetobacter sp.]MCI1314871.1 peptide chain release factor N(5)-glutamine methyltransferase [Acetobacter sp.]